MSYKNPPPEFQFQPGQSGNPKGRPKSLNESKAALLRKLLAEPVEITELGQKYFVTAKQALVKSILNKARKGDPAAIKLSTGYYDSAQNETVLYVINDEDGIRSTSSIEVVIENIDRANAKRVEKGLPEFNIEDLIEDEI